MKIDSSSLSFQASHAALIRDESQESLRMWQGERRPDFAPTKASANSMSQTRVSLSQAARLSLAADAGQIDLAARPKIMPPMDTSTSQTSGEAEAVAAAEDAINNDPMLALLRSMIEHMTGQPMKLFSAAELGAAGSGDAPALPPSTGHQAAPPPRASAGFGVEYDYHAVHEEIEVAEFAAAGVIRTQDGQEIAFKLELSMTREYREETTLSVRAGNAVRKDPLVFNFNGKAAQLSEQRFRFDLDSDGIAEHLAMLSGGSGYLALDRNQNGRIDNGRELFGPQTDSGFAELALLDTDGNGWVDENDAVFDLLKVWQPASDGDGKLSSLAALGVGAISTAHVATPFELRGAANADLGAITASGLFLYEQGGAGSIQEIDLTV